MLILGNKQTKNIIPSAHIELSIPRRDGDFGVPSTIYQQDLSTVQRINIDQTFNLRLSIIPGDKNIFDMNPTYFLYRYTSRAKKKNVFRGAGKKLVHPSDATLSLSGHRYRNGQHTNPYPILSRITEVPAIINIHSNGQKEFYGGTNANPDGTIFAFNPLAWMTNSSDISAQSIQFPQPLFQDNPGSYDTNIGIESQNIQQISGQGIYQFRNTSSTRKSGSRVPKRYFYGIQLMVKNPDYIGGSQVPQYLAISNMVEFVVDYKIATLIDPVDGIIRKYAIDWRIRHNEAK